MRSKIAAVKETLVKVGAGILQGSHLRLVDDEDEQRKQKQDEVVHRKVSALRTKEKKFETIICQVDRSTGEVIIPKKDRGMIRALKRASEHRTMGWIVAAAIATFGSIAAYHEVTPAQAIAIERVDMTRSHNASANQRHPWNGAHRNDGRYDQASTSGIAPVVATAASDSAVVVAVAEGPKMENVRIRTEFHVTHRADGAIGVWSENIYESRPVGSTPPAWTPAAPVAEKVEIVNINTASEADIDRILPGVGPVMAKAIVKNRPYRTIQDLRKVRGIGARRFADLAPLVKIS